MNNSSIIESCIADKEISDIFSKPIRFVGYYIVIASLFCIYLMQADLVDGFRKKQLWLPSKLFSLNAASITAIAVALKLPVDLTTMIPQDMSTVAKLRQHVRRYWVMAETGSPQFAMASSPLSTASSVICLVVFFVNLVVLLKVVFVVIYRLGYIIMGFHDDEKSASPYKESIVYIFAIQSIGIVIGASAPLTRCYSVFSFKNYIMVLKVEKYWTQKLHEWKEIPFYLKKMNRKQRSLVNNSKYIVLSLCIIFQKMIVILCKVVWIIVTTIPVFVVRCFTPLTSSTTDDIDEDLSSYVLQIEDQRELAEKVLKRILIGMNFFISKVEKEQHKNLLALLKKSTGFQGVKIFDDTDHVQPLHSLELVNSWSLPIVTLTCIAVAIPNIRKGIVESLLTSVDEGLSFIRLVVESLNSASEYVNIQKATLILWHEIENKRRWLNNPLTGNVFEGKTTAEIITWFSDKSKEIVTKISQSTNGGPVGNPPKALIAANSMYRITQTILLRYQSNTEPITKKQLFAHLNWMIADIFCACFTNIPRVIRMRCHESVIEKREASVRVAAELLGKTTKIIELLETREVPHMDDDQMAYIDKWRLYLRQSTP